MQNVEIEMTIRAKNPLYNSLRFGILLFILCLNGKMVKVTVLRIMIQIYIPALILKK